MDLRLALDEQNIDKVAAAYGKVRGVVTLASDDVNSLAQALHTALRQKEGGRDQRVPPHLITFSDTLVKDIRDRKLPPSTSANLHLLSFLRETQQFDRAFQFWSWLVDQDDSYVGPSIYGVAIELMAIQGRPAHEAEDLYTQAVKRFPGTFNEYHLSPRAIVPDRTQPIAIKGVPMTLLQGIVTARLLQGSVKDAYLGLDVALRLRPNEVPSRLFVAFIEERPVAEAYKVFMIACRAGTPLHQDSLTKLLVKLRDSAARTPLRNAAAIRAMLTAVHAYTADSGGVLSTRILTELVAGISSLLHGADVLSYAQSHANQVTDKLMNLLHKLFSLFSRRQAPPGVAAFNSIIHNVAGKGQREDIIATVMAEMKSLGIEPTSVTYRSCLTAAGEMGSKALIESAWKALVHVREQSGRALEFPDWLMLTRASIKCSHNSFVTEQIEILAHAVTPFISGRVKDMLENSSTSDDRPRNIAPASEDPAVVLRILADLGRDIAALDDQMSAGRTSRPELSQRPLPMSLGQDSQSSVDKIVEQELRAVYDELTEDPMSPQTSSDTALIPPAKTATGYPFDDIRYENWKSINELLAEAEAHDTRYAQAVDEAIRKNEPPPKRDMGWKQPGFAWTKGVTVGLSDFLQDPKSISPATSDVAVEDAGTTDLPGFSSTFETSPSLHNTGGGAETGSQSRSRTSVSRHDILRLRGRTDLLKQ